MQKGRMKVRRNQASLKRAVKQCGLGGQRSEEAVGCGTGKTRVERVQSGVEAFSSANVCDPNTRADLVSAESLASFSDACLGTHLGSYE